mmetsp:Transcript_58148/g.138387  ORF Transcript_58148/g.138387 Transcript_58148/m.138387 type:complete len:300 (+) Transcript_58148:71-970(+)|eukprot:CAMPEP_0178418446 /NCGR_PEP_ID=MMETSP0689_2-20121128/25091_1 /TAXON_ID=160604 /ORGANISM="Amphidinium massartii, Strain CS-259" /LENGTH=299 /DNA_ID=CAMNT_0020039837 /DNA_START=71 /DNA_END=970 /DNA_ORIENTATION=+
MAGLTSRKKGGISREGPPSGVKKNKGGSQQPFGSTFLICGTLVWVALAGFLMYRKFSEPKKGPKLKEMTDETLAKLVGDNPNGVLVNFHMEGCQHCEKLAPEYLDAARLLRTEGGPPLVAARMDAAPLATQLYGVTRFPTLLWFQNGRAVNEASPTVRTSDKIIEYVKWVQQPALVEFETLAELEEAVPQLRSTMQAKGPPVIAAFANKEHAAALLPAFEFAAQKSRGKAAFIFIKEVATTDAADEPIPIMRAYFSSASADKEYNGSVSEAGLHLWVSDLLKQGKEKGKTDDDEEAILE